MDRHGLLSAPGDDPYFGGEKKIDFVLAYMKTSGSNEQTNKLDKCRETYLNNLKKVCKKYDCFFFEVRKLQPEVGFEPTTSG